jgi:phosphonate metabolism-associated iron-containing alcohol dehydrogenase
MTDYFNPVKIIRTNNWEKALSLSMEELEISKPLLITSLGHKRRLELELKFSSNSIFSDFKSNPTFDNCDSAINFCKNKIFDGVIALGGGSAMDLAKVVISHLCLKKNNVIDLIEYDKSYPQKIPSIFVPTTHGTASEVTMWGTIWNMKEKKKYSISHTDLYPNFAVLDGNLTLTLPLDMSIITTMDALSHSFESIWNKKANPISTEYAIEAISIIIENVFLLKRDQNNLELRNNLLNASSLAGLAFSNTTTAAAHSISYPLTIHYGIPHGIASSITLIALLGINKNLINDSLSKICSKCNMSYDNLKKLIMNIPKDIVSYRLRDWGVQKSDLNKLVSESFTKGRMDNNIIDLNEDDVIKILKIIY